ncbi:inverted formin-2 [Anaeramoeba flamelloides]|uniref:Inverted formin-2 n=1 Tax=Anaeramoeba flamelloides TaxID=1746091 RepID=A0AAV7YMR1_9EUKA|nr:inverted formin-2 [Anaeramoeba flamelloides]
MVINVITLVQNTIQSIEIQESKFSFSKLCVDLANTSTTTSTNQKAKKLQQDLPMPPENELNNMFENLLSLEVESGKSLENTTKTYTDQLKTNCNLQFMIELRTALSSNPLSWMIEFLGLGGLSLLIDSLSRLAHKPPTQKTKSDEGLTNEFLRSFKAMMNNSVGLEAFLSDKKYTIVIVLCLDLQDWSVLQRVIELLIVVSVFPPNGHKYCLESLSYFREKRNLKSRFAVLTNLLKRSIGDQGSKEFQESCVMLINSLIDTPQEPYVCLELRKEFALLGIRRILKK